MTFTLPPRAFAAWDTTAHAWRVVGGTYRIMLGAGSRDIRLSGSVELP